MAPPPTLQELIEIVRRDAGSDLPIDQLVVAATAAAQLEETTDALLGHFVDRCRRDGRSWTEISAALGVTKQAVHKRFASAMATQLAAASPRPTFERFTDRARHVLAESRRAAIGLGDGFVGTEHLLLALFSEPAGLAARALAAMDVTEDSVRAAVAAAGPRTAEAAGDADSTA
ncbi:MAG: Clp protease N-terminal domain-containing protein, partial [Streptosporangiaceae bacterium]